MAKQIQSASGRTMENYKQWYYVQPKFFRVVILPFIMAFSVIIIEIQQLDKLWLLIPAFSLSINLYHQYLDTLIEDQVSELVKRRDFWKGLQGRYSFLNNMLNSLVVQKSTMFIETTYEAKNVDKYESETVSKESAAEIARTEAINYIRDANSYEKNIDRILGILHQVFLRYADDNKDQKFRVTYLVPDKDNRKLIARAHINSDDAPPTSVTDDNNRFFILGDRTVAGHLWGKDGCPSVLIDNVTEYLEKNRDNPIFTYTHGGQSAYLKAILCYKVYDHKAKTCLGILCIDTNIPDKLTQHLQFFDTVLEAISNRIIFETRCKLMKNTLDINR